MNPWAVLLLILAVGLGIGALILNIPYSILWLLGLFTVLGSLAVQALWPPARKAK